MQGIRENLPSAPFQCLSDDHNLFCRRIGCFDDIGSLSVDPAVYLVAQLFFHLGLHHLHGSMLCTD